MPQSCYNPSFGCYANTRHMHRYPAFHLLMPLYVCRRWEGTPTPKEGQELAWVRPARLGDYPMPPADAPMR